MLALIIILAVLLLILTFPLGVDAAYSSEQSYLKLKLGAFRKTLLPRDSTKPRKEKKKAEAPAKPDAEEKKKSELKLTLDDILTLAEIGLNALHRFRMHLSVDLFRLHWTAAASDPYDAVLQYGRVNAGLGALSGGAHRALKIREEDVSTELDLCSQKPLIDTRLVLSIQIWELLFIGACAGCAGLRWYTKKKRAERAAVAAAERSMEDGEL